MSVSECFGLSAWEAFNSAGSPICLHGRVDGKASASEIGVMAYVSREDGETLIRGVEILRDGQTIARHGWLPAEAFEDAE